MGIQHALGPLNHERRGATDVLKNPKGIALVWGVLAGALFFVLGGLAVDFALLQSARTELQNGADSAALAAVEQLRLPEVGDIEQQMKDAAMAMGENNLVAGEPLTLAEADLDPGHYDQVNGAFDSTPSVADGFNAIEVTARRSEGAPDGPVDLFFARLFGADSVDLEVTAMAMVGGRNLILTLDRSSSMKSVQEFPPEPFTGMKSAALFFVDQMGDTAVTDDRMGMVYYDHFIFPLHSLTEDFDSVEATINSVNTIENNRFTGIASAIQTSLALASGGGGTDFGVRIIVLLSDGRATATLDGTTPLDLPPGQQMPGSPLRNLLEQQARAESIEQANDAADEGVLIWTISFGESADEELMIEIADITNGAHFPATGGIGELQDAFDSIAAGMPLLLVE